MKTIEDKAKAYDEALERAKEKYPTCYSPTLLDYIFPELKENKDIEIKKDIIRSLKIYIKWIKDGYDTSSAKDFVVKEIEKQIAWLEKQVNKDSQIKLPTFTFDDILALQCCMETVKKVQNDKDLYEKLNDLHGRVYDAYHLEKQGEQKPVDSYCQKNCRGFQETGKCFADGECKAKREAESTDKVEQSSINEIEIPFGAKDSELQEAIYHIPKGFHAEIDDDKVVIKKGEKPAAWSEDDERIKKRLINLVNEVYNNTNYITFLEHKELLAWLEKLDDNMEL